MFANGIGQVFLAFRCIAKDRRLPYELNDVDYISQIYLTEFNPPEYKQAIMNAASGYYKYNDDLTIQISDTQIDDTWKKVYGDPHYEGLIEIQELEYTTLKLEK